MEDAGGGGVITGGGLGCGVPVPAGGAVCTFTGSAGVVTGLSAGTVVLDEGVAGVAGVVGVVGVGVELAAADAAFWAGCSGLNDGSELSIESLRSA